MQFSLNHNSGEEADVWVNYHDANNGYRVRSYLAGGEIWLETFYNGKWVHSYAYLSGNAQNATLGVKSMYVSPNWRTRVYLNGTQIIDEVATGHTSGGVALGGTSPKFDDLKVGYYTEHDQGGSVKADGDLEPIRLTPSRAALTRRSESPVRPARCDEHLLFR